MITRRMLGTALLVVAAVTSLAGTFRELYRIKIVFTGGTQVHAMSCWEYLQDDFGMQPGMHPPRYGIPITVAAAVLIAAAVLVLRGNRWGRGLAAVGAGGLTTAVWSAAESYFSTLSQADATPVNTPDRNDVIAGDGLMLLIVAVVITLVGVVLVAREGSVPDARPEPPADGVVIHQLEDDADDTDTPAYGFPAVEIR